MKYFLQWLGAFAIVIAKPLYDLFARNPTYFVVNGIQGADLAMWVAGLAMILPLGFALGIFLVARKNRQAADRINGFLLGIMAAMFALQVCQHIGIDNVGPAAAVAGLAFIASSWLFIAQPKVLFGLSLLAPAALVLAVLFIREPGIQKILRPTQTVSLLSPEVESMAFASKPMIVFVVLDELSLVDLLDTDGEIDAGRFPNFAAFADDSYWFANAVTDSADTRLALPAILTGRRPATEQYPSYRDHPRNLFTLLQPHYELNVLESLTRLNPWNEEWREFADVRNAAHGGFKLLASDSLVAFLHLLVPSGASHLLPPIHFQWGGFLGGNTAKTESPGPSSEAQATNPALERIRVRQRMMDHMVKGDRKALFGAFTDSLSTAGAESGVGSLNFLHILLPHRPHEYLPSGRNYRKSSYLQGLHRDQEAQAWTSEQTGLNGLHQQHLLQAAFVDGLWGDLVAELKAAGRYEDSIVVLMSDHGVSFRTGIPNRRFAPENLAELAFIPLFIKPANHSGAVRSDRHATTIDILPSLVDLLGIDPQWNFDGQSLFGSEPEGPAVHRIDMQDGSSAAFQDHELRDMKHAAMQRMDHIFKRGDTRSDLFHYQDGLELLGTALDRSILDTCTIHSADFETLSTTWPGDDDLPQKVFGRIDCEGEIPQDLLVVITDRGQVFGTTRPWKADGDWVFAYIFPDFGTLPDEARFALRVINYP